MTKTTPENDVINLDIAVNKTEIDADTSLCDIFAALDGVQASSEREDAALAAILALAGEAQPAEATEGEAPSPGESQPQAEPVAESASKLAESAPAQGVRTARKANSRNVRARFRVIRIAAIAACLVFALTGGAAYATPAGYVQVGEGDDVIELGVNIFGITVRAETPNDDMEKRVEEADLLHKPYAEALEDAVELVEDAEGGTKPPAITVQPGGFGPHDRLQEEADRAYEQAEQRAESRAREAASQAAANAEERPQASTQQSRQSQQVERENTEKQAPQADEPQTQQGGKSSQQQQPQKQQQKQDQQKQQQPQEQQKQDQKNQQKQDQKKQQEPQKQDQQKQEQQKQDPQQNQQQQDQQKQQDQQGQQKQDAQKLQESANKQQPQQQPQEKNTPNSQAAADKQQSEPSDSPA